MASKARSLEAQHREHESLLSEVMDDRALWDKLTQVSRRLAVQADCELRRRYPDRKTRPLESAERRAPDEPTVEPGWLAELNEQRRVFREELEARQNVRAPNEDPTGKTKAQPGDCGKASGTRCCNHSRRTYGARGVLEAAHERAAEHEGCSNAPADGVARHYRKDTEPVHAAGGR